MARSRCCMTSRASMAARSPLPHTCQRSLPSMAWFNAKKMFAPPSPLRFSFYKRLAPKLMHTPCPPPHRTSTGSSMQHQHHSSTWTRRTISSTLSSSMRSAQPPLLPTPSATLGAFLPTLLPGSNQTSPLVGSGCTRVYTCMEQVLPSHLEVKCARARSLGRYS